MLSGQRFIYLAFLFLFVSCLFCDFSCVNTGAGKLGAGNGWSISLTLLLVLLLLLGRMTVLDMVCSCEGSREDF